MQLPKLTGEILTRILPPEGTFLLAFRGSIAHNTWEPPESEFSTDDIDLMGVALADDEHYIGLKPWYTPSGAYERFVGEWDSVVYEFRKFVGLLANANPNVLNLLWLPPELYVLGGPGADLLIENRNLFATKRIFDTFTGYANQQIYRMEHNACEGYMGEKRKKLVERFGYDTKNASHAIRLLRMGTEFLETGRMNVWREDRESLLEIKHGEWTLDGVKREAETLSRRAEEAYKRSKLPEQPDMDTINRLMLKIWSMRGDCEF